MYKIFHFGLFRVIILLSFMLLNKLSSAQVYSRSIEWYSPYTIETQDNKSVKVLNFKNALSDENYLPLYNERFIVTNPNVTFILSDQRFEPVTTEINKENIGTSILPQTHITYNLKKTYATVRFIPLRINPSTNIVEKLVAFKIELRNISELQSKTGNISTLSYAANSVLQTGTWYKVGINSDGVYKITSSQLYQLGVDVKSIEVSKIRIYGNGGGMLPLVNTDFRPDDLMENAIYVKDENSNNKFDQADYILFYGKNQDKWTLNQSDNRFHHQKNFYADTAFYFLNFDLGLGKRIQQQPNLSQTATHIVNTFDDYQYYEKDRFNFIKSGREWFGDPFDIEPTQNFNFNFPNIDLATQVYYKTDFAARNFDQSNGSHFKTFYNSQQIQDIKVNGVCSSFLCDYCATAGASTSNLFTAVGSDIALKIVFTTFTTPANGWLNYIELNARRQLILNGSSMSFRDKNSVGAGNISQFNVNNLSSTAYHIWDVTNPWNVAEQDYSWNNLVGSFKINTDSLRQFIVFGDNGFNSPNLIGKIENQDLHALPLSDMLIVTHPLFLEQANRLAEFHRTHDTLRVEVATTDQVYNEFSSGAQDATAIRNFIKMFYDRAQTPSDYPKYLLLFGDGSYDNRNLSYATGNFVVTYQSANSCVLTGSYTSDDYFGLLDDGEGSWSNIQDVDIGIGRFPVATSDQAEMVVNKTINYESVPGSIIQGSNCANAQCSPLGDWRTWTCFVADDEDGDLHMGQADVLARSLKKTHPLYNQEKVYIDAFQQVSTPGGQRYPDAKDALNKRIDKGTLVVNYTGHGGELGWTEERILELSDIRGWKNYCRLPLFITATCEFSRYDDPGRTSAGEYVLINSEAGGIALFTTTRLAFSNSNFSMNDAILDALFTPINNKWPRLGDVFLSAKTIANDPNNRGFTCLGDPALKLAYPDNKIITKEINAQPIVSLTDTLEALSYVTIKGEVQDFAGNKVNTFNGIVYPSVFDKSQQIRTLGNDAASPDSGFALQKNILYKGKAEVTNGDFSFSFIVPKDISYQYGYGRLSYYAQDGTHDAAGYFDSVMIGGINTNASSDNNGPQIKLYINNNKFVYGGVCDQNPQIYAELADSNGINTVGNGIGHDLVAQLDDQNDKVFTLNDYYENDLNSYKTGKVLYPLQNLSTGTHTLKLKAWDIYNNSSDAFTEFVVAESASLALDNVLNYPNPFTTKTRFLFDLNRCCQQLAIEVRIFTVSGKLIKTINRYQTSDGNHIDNIEWDGKDDYGDAIAKGVYLYKIKVSSVDGQSAEKIEKLVILK